MCFVHTLCFTCMRPNYGSVSPPFTTPLPYYILPDFCSVTYVIKVEATGNLVVFLQVVHEASQKCYQLIRLLLTSKVQRYLQNPGKRNIKQKYWQESKKRMSAQMRSPLQSDQIIFRDTDWCQTIQEIPLNVQQIQQKDGSTCLPTRFTLLKISGGLQDLTTVRGPFFSPFSTTGACGLTPH